MYRMYEEKMTAPTTQLLARSNRRVLIAAHRGAWGVVAPENSTVALQRAIALEADIVEIDVRTTRDGVLVLQHDLTLNRMSTGAGPIDQADYEQVRDARLKAGNGDDDSAVTSLRVTTLAEALEVARDRILVNVDIKDDALFEPVAQAVIAAGMARQVFVKGTIADKRDVDRIRNSAFFGRIAFVPMMTARPGRFIEDLRIMEPLECPMYEIAFSDLADLEIGRDELARQGARLWVNTIDCSHSLDFNDTRALADPHGVWGKLVDAGVGAIQTDVPGVLADFLFRLGAR